MKDDPTTYDQVPYTINAYPMTHPSHVAVVARLFGVDAADPTNARILEIGCGHGGNILPMAEQLPNSEFVAIDLSETHVTNAKVMAEAANLTNVEIIQKDIATIDKTLGEFDYIIAHGVYSWVPAEVQSSILRICSENLKPNGVAFVSYNTYPGWRLKESVRDMLLIHTEKYEKPEDILRNAKSLLRFLEEAAKKQDTPYSKFIQPELANLQKVDPNYFFHDTLEENNHPIYFKEFYQRLIDADLAYLGDSTIRTMLTSDLDAEIRKTLENATKDIITREQYLDFLRNRTFRQSLICHNDTKIDRNVKPEPFKEFSYRSNFASDSSIDLTDGVDAAFSIKTELRINVKQSLEKAVLHELQKAAPKSLTYSEIIDRSKHSLKGIIDDSTFEKYEASLFASLFRLYQTGGLDIQAHAPEIVDYISDKPKVSHLARVQAKLGLALISRYHGNCKLDHFQNQIIAFVDGEHTVQEIVNELLEATTSDQLTLKQNGKPVEDPEQLKTIYSAKTTQLLNILAANALLIG